MEERHFNELSQLFGGGIVRAQFKPNGRRRGDCRGGRRARYRDVYRQANQKLWNRGSEHLVCLLPSARSGFCANEGLPPLRSPARSRSDTLESPSCASEARLLASVSAEESEESSVARALIDSGKAASALIHSRRRIADEHSILLEHGTHSS
jgi:hypothetical protein